VFEFGKEVRGGTIDINEWCLCEGTGEDKQEGKLIERVMIYWLGLLERDETSVSGTH
jgi:hypothetical protein